MISGKAEQCCGCTACEKICGRGAITMQENEKGFLYPVIDAKRCSNCGLCDSVCPLKCEGNGINENAVSYIAAKRIDGKKRGESQSGGAFAGLAEEILQQGGCVYGVALNKELQAEYTRVTTPKNLERLKGSKYVQASVGDTYLQVKADLEQGKWVLYSGTPCHVHGLLCFLRKRGISCEKLVTVDLICHGVPSPKLYREYLRLLSRDHGGKRITGFNFRNKDFGWHGHTASFSVDRSNFINNDYTKLFYSSYCLRDSCYVCKYSSLKRAGDLSIGDCWGIEKFAKEFDDNKGCSLILVNTQKGQALLDSVLEKFQILHCKRDQILQTNLMRPTEKPQETDLFWSDYFRYGCEYVMIRHCDCDPAQEYEQINTKQYVKRAIRKAQRIYHRIFY